METSIKKGGIRWLTLIAGIMDFMIAVGMVALSIYLFTAMISVPDKVIAITLGLWSVLCFIILGLGCIVGLAFLIAGIVVIRLGSKNDIDYAKKKGTIVTYLVLDFLIIATLVIASFFTGSMMIYMLIIAAFILIVAILKLIDYKIFWKKVKDGKIDLTILQS